MWIGILGKLEQEINFHPTFLVHNCKIAEMAEILEMLQNSKLHIHQGR